MITLTELKTKAIAAAQYYESSVEQNRNVIAFQNEVWYTPLVIALIEDLERAREALKEVVESPHWDLCDGLRSSTTTSKTDFTKCDCHVAYATAALAAMKVKP